MPAPTYLEDLPIDILKRIAYLTASRDLDPPSDLRALLLSNSYLYKKLNPHVAHDLYLRLFQTKFDPTCSWRPGLTDGAISLEFVRRFRILRRPPFVGIPAESLYEDLWAVLWMALENNGKNETHFSLNNFSTYAISLARHYLHRDTGHLTESCGKVQAIIVCLLCYMFTRETLVNTPQETREELLLLLRPFATTGTLVRDLPGEVCLHAEHHRAQKDTSTSPHSLNEQPAGHVVPEGLLASTTSMMLLSRPLTSAIILIFAMKELAPLQIPSHLPATRALARSMNRTGPTIQDFEATERCTTPLLADLRNDGKLCAPHSSRVDILCDPEILMLVRANMTSIAADITAYLPGMLTGVWEGSYLVEGTTSSAVANFVCRKPMQCAITEYICYRPNIPFDNAPEEFFKSDLKPSDVNITEGGVEIQSHTYCYEKFTPGGDEKGSALDILLFGETLEEHEQAWGGYKFVGKVSRDGRIVLKREPKQFEDTLLGTWCFVGHLRYGSAFVGQWKSGTQQESVRGIFSMRKNFYA